MNTEEGLRRLAAVVRWVGYLIGLPVAALSLFGFGKGQNDEAGFFLAVGLLISAMGWVAAWIIEGFAKPKT